MKEDFVKEGMWSTSLDFEKPVFGILIYSKSEGLKLEMKGIFDIYKVNKIKHIKVYGKTDHFNTKITLVDCDPIKFNISSIDFKVNKCFIGSHIEDTEGLKVKSANLEYFGLQDYLGNSGFNIDKNENYEYSVNYNRPTSLKVTIDNLELGIFHSYSQFSQIDRGQSGEIEMKMKEYITVKYDYQNLVSIDKCMEDSQSFSFFMATVSNNVIYPKNIELTLGDGKKLIYIYRNPYFKNKYDNDDNNFISFNELSLNEILPTWFSYKERFKTFANYKRVSDLYHNHYDENRLLDSSRV